MSQNKTVVPGMGTTSPEHRFDTDQVKNESTRPTPKKTYCPEMEMNAPGYNAVQESTIVRPDINPKPIVGFLYSISRKGVGEYWPLYIGPNKIGRSNTSDICLSEGSVSEQHAELVIRKMKNPEKTIASITDYRSTCGTMINGTSISFNAHECFNNDIITIGDNYELLLILIDAKAMNLHVAENFIPIAPEETTPVNPYSKNMDTPFTDSNYNYNRTGSEFDFMNTPENRGTIPLDGPKPLDRGKTKIL